MPPSEQEHHLETGESPASQGVPPPETVWAILLEGVQQIKGDTAEMRQEVKQQAQEMKREAQQTKQEIQQQVQKLQQQMHQLTGGQRSLEEKCLGAIQRLQQSQGKMEARTIVLEHQGQQHERRLNGQDAQCQQITTSMGQLANRMDVEVGRTDQLTEDQARAELHFQFLEEQRAADGPKVAKLQQDSAKLQQEVAALREQVDCQQEDVHQIQASSDRMVPLIEEIIRVQKQPERKASVSFREPERGPQYTSTPREPSQASNTTTPCRGNQQQMAGSMSPELITPEASIFTQATWGGSTPQTSQMSAYSTPTAPDGAEMEMMQLKQGVTPGDGATDGVGDGEGASQVQSSPGDRKAGASGGVGAGGAGGAGAGDGVTPSSGGQPPTTPNNTSSPGMPVLMPLGTGGYGVQYVPQMPWVAAAQGAKRNRNQTTLPVFSGKADQSLQSFLNKMDNGARLGNWDLQYKTGQLYAQLA